MILPNQTEPVLRTIGSGAFITGGILPAADYEFKCVKGMLAMRVKGAGDGTGVRLPYPCEEVIPRNAPAGKRYNNADFGTQRSKSSATTDVKLKRAN